MTDVISISGRKIGQKYSPYVIAEMSANHNGSIENALKIIAKAKESGVDAIKIQTYTPDTITINCNAPDFKIQNGLWSGKTLYQLYELAHTPWEWHKPLFDYAKALNLTIFSSPFDKTAVDFLERLDVPAYKIASFEVIDIPLIKYVAATGKPMIISTGMANLNEIQDAVDAARTGGCNDLAILHCVSGYPAPPEDYNLKTIPDMVERFGVVTGISDHSIGYSTAIAAVSLGASIVEKHFTLDKNGKGPDDSFSIEPEEMFTLCRSLKDSWLAIGGINYQTKSSEQSNIKFRRSLYFVNNLKIGHIVKDSDVRSIRPGYGLPPKEIDNIIGKQLCRDVVFGQPVSWDDFQ